MDVDLSTRSGVSVPAQTILLAICADREGQELVQRVNDCPRTVRLDIPIGQTLVRLKAFIPPGRLAADIAFRPGVTASERTSLVLDTGLESLNARDDLPARSITPAATKLSLVERSSLQVVDRPDGAVPRIGNLPLGGAPGDPSLPVEVHYVLMPPGAGVASVEARPDAHPVQVKVSRPRRQPPLRRDSPQALPTENRLPGPSPAIGLHPTLRLQVAAASAVAARTLPPIVLRPQPPLFPARSVELGAVHQHSWGSVATVKLWPVQYDAVAKRYVHQPQLAYDLKVRYAPGDNRSAVLFPGIANRDHAALLTAALTSPQVKLAPGALSEGKFIFDPQAWISAAPAGMVIITDDSCWNGTGPAPPFIQAASVTRGPVIGKNSAGRGMIDEFERLAHWKTARGTRTKVVSIETIKAMHDSGEFDPFMPGRALDLPEMVRGFVLYAAAKWQTSFLLIGGGPAIVPMRQVMGARGADFVRGKNASISKADDHVVAKLSADKAEANDLTDTAVKVDPRFNLVCLNSGSVVPFEPTGAGARGWYFTSDADFKSKTSGFEKFVSVPDPDRRLRVIAFGGPEMDDDFVWVWPDRACETDHYYSDLIRAPKPNRDFDANGNTLLGQVIPVGDGDNPIDGVSIQGAVYVGRAPVRDAEEARRFVDKVIGYETLSPGDAPAIDPSYFRNLALYADNWAHPWNFAQYPNKTGAKTPQPGEFVWQGNDVIATLQDDPTGGDYLAKTLSGHDVDMPPPFSLQAYFDASGEIVVIPYDKLGKQIPSWAFCDAGFNRLSTSGGVVSTANVRVVQAPAGFDMLFWQNPNVDYASSQKERVHEAFRNLFPSLDAVQRVYRDNVDFPGQDIRALTQETADALLDQGVHFLSVTGHGNVNNVGYITESREPENAGKPFIMYAHSCLTTDPQASPSLGEFFVTRTNGAVAYVGYARSCWTGDPVAAYETGFWCGVRSFRRLGPPIAAHLNSANWQQFSHIFMTTLYGDPEMPIWTSPPRRADVTFDYEIVPKGELFAGLEYVTVTANLGGRPIAGLQVTALQGWAGSHRDPEWYYTSSTDNNGVASIVLKSPRHSALRLVVSSPPESSGPLYAPVIKDFAVGQVK